MPIEDADTRAALDAMLARVEAAAAQISRKGAQLVEARSKGKLHTGYGVVSGTMRRSIHTTGPIPNGEGVFSSLVGPSVIYARRFELGFINRTDTLGRYFAARGEQGDGLLGSIKRPFFKPAIVESIPQIQRLAEATWGDAISMEGE